MAYNPITAAFINSCGLNDVCAAAVFAYERRDVRYYNSRRSKQALRRENKSGNLRLTVRRTGRRDTHAL